MRIIDKITGHSVKIPYNKNIAYELDYKDLLINTILENFKTSKGSYEIICNALECEKLHLGFSDDFIKTMESINLEELYIPEEEEEINLRSIKIRKIKVKEIGEIEIWNFPYDVPYHKN